MMKKRPTKGYTLTELVFVLGMLAGFVVMGLMIYTVIHFVGKFW